MGVYVPDGVRRTVREAARDRCGYCLSPQRYLIAPLEIEHIVPLVRGGANEEINLWLACPSCNRFKGTQIDGRDPVAGAIHPLFNPRWQRWDEHFRWSCDGVLIEGITPVGRATVVALRLNHELAVAVRQNWVAAGWHPPKD